MKLLSFCTYVRVWHVILTGKRWRIQLQYFRALSTQFHNFEYFFSFEWSESFETCLKLSNCLNTWQAYLQGRSKLAVVTRRVVTGRLSPFGENIRFLHFVFRQRVCTSPRYRPLLYRQLRPRIDTIEMDCGNSMRHSDLCGRHKYTHTSTHALTKNLKDKFHLEGLKSKFRR